MLSLTPTLFSPLSSALPHSLHILSLRIIACVLREAELLLLPVGPCPPLLAVSLPKLLVLLSPQGAVPLAPPC